MRYAVWVDRNGAAELTAACGITVGPGLLYAGVSHGQSLRTHLRHSDIGSLTLMKSLAALLRTEWDLTATSNGRRLHDPGRERLRQWMRTHLTVTWSTAAPDDDDLAGLDPPLRLTGHRPDRTPLRAHLTVQRRQLR